MKLKNISKKLKDLGKGLLALWQTKDSGYANTSVAAVVFLILSVIFALLSIATNNSETSIFTDFSVFAFGYLSLLTLLLAIVCIYSWFYVNNSCRVLTRFRTFFFVILLILIGVVAILSLPIVIVLSLCMKGANQVKTWHLDDTLYGYLSVILLFLCLSILNPFINSSLTICFISILSEALCAANLSINGYAATYFTITTLLLIESYLLSLPISILIVHLRKSPENKDYIIAYTKNCITKARLAVLIILFVGATFGIAPIGNQELHSSDIINTLTIYTLLLLYVDKSHEMGKKLQGYNNRGDTGFDEY